MTRSGTKFSGRIMAAGLIAIAFVAIGAGPAADPQLSKSVDSASIAAPPGMVFGSGAGSDSSVFRKR